jgi:GDP-4-dehydro-6-deoxy-D-mannose reductase
MKIFYNGSSGSLGRYFAPAISRFEIQGRALQARLEDTEALNRELSLYDSHITRDDPIFLVQMAALVSVTACEQDPEGAFKTNITDTVQTVRTFVAWARRLGASPLVIYVSTGHVYKAPVDRIPVTEDHEVLPRSVYAKTKLQAEMLLKELSEQLEVPVLVGRVFGLIAPQQPSHYVLPGLIRRVQMQTLANVPGLEYQRDYLDSRDVCDALARLCTVRQAWETDRFNIVNICSGKEVSIRQILEETILALRSERQADLLQDLSAGPGRCDDVPWLVGSCAKLERITGTVVQQISLQQTIRDAIRDYRKVKSTLGEFF